jgi:hypothetical protein
MNITSRQNPFRTIRPGDKNFTITDGIMGTNRAGFEISEDCPDLYKNTLIRALNSGWIKPIAHVTERELIFMGLTNN